MSRIGLYLGGDSLSVVAASKGNFLSSEKYSLDAEGGVSAEDTIQLEVLLNKMSREMNVSQGDDLYLSLHDRDFIFRSFVIPCMTRKEIESSVEFEIEKYIPFKIEELIWNYSYERIVNEKKLIVSFIGYNKQIYKRLSDTFSKLQLNLVAAEPSSLSLLRLVRAKKDYSRLDWYVILDYTSSDCYITFFYRTLPVFSRTIQSSPGEAMDGDKLIEEIRFSFQYFKREYRAYDLEKMIVISGEQLPGDLDSLREELDVDIDFILPQECAPSPGIEQDMLKAYAAGQESNVSSFKPLLEDLKTGFLYSKKGMAGPLNIPLLAGVAVLGIILTIVSSAAIKSDIAFSRKRLADKQSQFDLKGKLAGSSLSQLKDALASREAAIALAGKKISALTDSNVFLNKIVSFISEGLWFSDFRFSSVSGKKEIQLSGYVYRGDQEKERESLDEFISRIRTDGELNGVFSSPLFFNQERTDLAGFSVLRFIIKLN